MKYINPLTYGIATLLINSHLVLAEQIKEGAYTNNFDDKEIYCFSAQDFEVM
jgi:hypothetical protein